MNSHDELSYIKIITRIMEEMSKENSKMKRELLVHRILIIMMMLMLIALFWIGAN
ncbi:hypothetical protein RZE82_07385 [Mollicutes bacterium LVI A0039]|nr:hypothetical protein RZE82_07385 [Mollicutes bacterium LVI A0039]